MLSQHPVGRTPLHPLLDQCRDPLAAAGIRPRLRTVLAGPGYVTEDNFARAEEQKLRLLAPLTKDPATLVRSRTTLIRYAEVICVPPGALPGRHRVWP